MKEYRRRELAEMARAYAARGHNTCTVSPFELLELLADEPADAQALADVRTLDEARIPDGHGRYRETVFGPPDKEGIRTTFIGEGATPDEARAKAAAWVREQARKAGT